MNAKKRNKKKKKNVLGLTPKGEDREDTDEDVDEEAHAYANAGSGPGLAFETAGGVVALKSKEDVARWIAERKRRYPTQANIAAKATLAKMSRRSVTVKVEEKKPSFNLGLDYPSGSEPEDVDKAKNGAKHSKDTDRVLITSEARDDGQELVASAESSPDPSVSDPDAPPDQEGTKTAQPGPSPPQRTQAIKAEAAKRDKDRSAPTKRIYCKNWTSYGSCTWKNCKFLHELPGVTDTARNERYAQQQQVRTRKNLYRRFLEKEQLQQKDKVLRFVKFLGENGRLDDSSEAVETED